MKYMFVVIREWWRDDLVFVRSVADPWSVAKEIAQERGYPLINVYFEKI